MITPDLVFKDSSEVSVLTLFLSLGATVAASEIDLWDATGRLTLPRNQTTLFKLDPETPTDQDAEHVAEPVFPLTKHDLSLYNGGKWVHITGWVAMSTGTAILSSQDAIADSILQDNFFSMFFGTLLIEGLGATLLVTSLPMISIGSLLMATHAVELGLVEHRAMGLTSVALLGLGYGVPLLSGGVSSPMGRNLVKGAIVVGLGGSLVTATVQVVQTTGALWQHRLSVRPVVTQDQLGLATSFRW